MAGVFFPRRWVADMAAASTSEFFHSPFFYTTALMLLDSVAFQNVNFNKCFVGLVKMKIHLGKQYNFM